VKEHAMAMKEKGVKTHSMNLKTLKAWECEAMVYEIGTYGISLTLPDMPAPVADTGKYMTIWSKESDGSMKIRFEIWNTDVNPMDMAKDMKKTMEKSMEKHVEKETEEECEHDKKEHEKGHEHE
jgi:hypothetical protein